MKHREVVALVIVALIALSLLAVPAASAEVTVTVCEGTLQLEGVIPGDTTFPDGNLHLRDQLAIYGTNFPECEFLNGTNNVVANANWHWPSDNNIMNAYGPVFGKFNKVVDAYPDTGFAGSYTGYKEAGSGTSIRLRGHGYGEFEGLKVSGNIEYETQAFGHITVHILDLHGE